MKTYSFIAILAASSLSAQSAVITGVSATADSTFNASTTVANIVNLSGLSAGRTNMNSTHGESVNGHSQWHTDLNVIADTNVTFDLNGVFDLTSIYIWNHNQTGLFDRGVNQFDIFVSSNGTDFTEVASDLSLTKSSGGQISANIVSLVQSGVSHVRLHIDSNHGDADVVGLSEVVFDGSPSSIPEPASTALLGVSSLALLLSRRR